MCYPKRFMINIQFADTADTSRTIIMKICFTDKELSCEPSDSLEVSIFSSDYCNQIAHITKIMHSYRHYSQKENIYNAIPRCIHVSDLDIVMLQVLKQ